MASLCEQPTASEGWPASQAGYQGIRSHVHASCLKPPLITLCVAHRSGGVELHHDQKCRPVSGGPQRRPGDVPLRRRPVPGAGGVRTAAAAHLARQCALPGPPDPAKALQTCTSSARECAMPGRSDTNPKPADPMRPKRRSPIIATSLVSMLPAVMGARGIMPAVHVSIWSDAACQG